MALPITFVLIIFMLSSAKTIILALTGAIVGVIVYYLLEVAREQKWCEFEALQHICSPSLNDEQNSGKDINSGHVCETSTLLQPPRSNRAKSYDSSNL